MPIPPLDKPLAELAEAVKRLNEASQTLNTTISNFEETLVGLNPGIAVWVENPLRIVTSPARSNHAVGSQLGFAKHDDKWGLWIRRGSFLKTGQGVWTPAPSPEWSLVSLVEGTRVERVAAIEFFPALVEGMTKEARERLASIEHATKGAR